MVKLDARWIAPVALAVAIPAQAGTGSVIIYAKHLPTNTFLLNQQVFGPAPQSIAAPFVDGFVAGSSTDANGGTVTTVASAITNLAVAYSEYSGQIALVGPPNLSTRVRFTAVGEMMSSGSGLNDQAVILSRDGEIFWFRLVGGLDGPVGYKRTTFRTSFILTPDSPVTFALTSGSSVNFASFLFGSPATPGFASSWLDPFISFGAVPEPATWALLIAGFGLVGARLRSRRLPAAA